MTVVIFFNFDELNFLNGVEEHTVSLLRRFNLMMAISCLFIFTFALIPLYVSYKFERRLRAESSLEMKNISIHIRTEAKGEIGRILSIPKILKIIFGKHFL